MVSKLTSIEVRWMNPYYYYRMSDNSEHISIQERIKDLILHDSKGLYYSENIPLVEEYSMNYKIDR